MTSRAQQRFAPEIGCLDAGVGELVFTFG